MLLLALSILTSVAPSLPVKKGTLYLQDAVDASTLICIGTVTGVDKVTLPAGWNSSQTTDLAGVDRGGPTEAQFGRIVVERVLKGDPTTKLAYHEAWPTWICDTTSARPHQRSLFFLSPSEVAAASPDVRQKVTTALGDAPVLRNVGSGDGIVPISLRNGEERVKFFGAPASLGLEGAKHHQRLTAMAQYIEVLARFAPERAVLHATSRPDQNARSRDFDFRVLGDGEARLATNGGDVVRVSILDASSWRVLQASLATLIGPDPISFGDPTTYRPDRSLRVSLPSAQLSFTDDESVIVSGMEDDAELARYRRVIRAWELVRETMNCADCVDHRARDAEVLGR